MAFRLGLFIVFFSLLVGYLGSGGNIALIFQPFELLEIVGISVGTFMMSSPIALQKKTLAKLPKLFQNAPYTTEDCSNLLITLFQQLKSATTSAIGMEQRLDSPESSASFQRLYAIPGGKDLVEFFCDYFRVVNSGFDKPYELDAVMERHIADKRGEVESIATSILKLGDALPAIGIVVAVLGVISAMGAIGSEASVLGIKVASALVGTFVGIFLAYGVVIPIGLFLEKFCSDEIMLFEAVRVAIISHANGNQPFISIEFARQSLPEELKPHFLELEKELSR